MKDQLRTAAVALLVVLGVLLAFSVCVMTRESTPDRARFLVNKKARYIVPSPIPGQFIFRPLPDAGDEALAKFDGVVTWVDLRRKDHPCYGYDLPKTPEWDGFTYYGREASLLRSVLLPEESRWDEAGNWRY